MWWIILIILAVLIVAGIIIVGGRRAREAQLENKREEAGELRREADHRRRQPASALPLPRSRPSRRRKSVRRPKKRVAARTRSIPT